MATIDEIEAKTCRTCIHYDGGDVSFGLCLYPVPLTVDRKQWANANWTECPCWQPEKIGGTDSDDCPCDDPAFNLERAR